MATKFSKFNQFNTFIPLHARFCNGMVIGCILSDDHNQLFIVKYSREIIDQIHYWGYDLDDDTSVKEVRLIIDGVYNFIVVIGESDDATGTLSSAINSAKFDVNLYCTDTKYYPYNRMINSPVEEKNILQSMFAVMEWTLFDVSIKTTHFKYDPFYHAFERACLQYNGGRQYAQIPDANTVFEVYKKCLKRWHIPEKEGEA